MFKIVKKIIFCVLVLLVSCKNQFGFPDDYQFAFSQKNFGEVCCYDGIYWSNWEYSGFILFENILMFPKEDFFFLMSSKLEFENKKDWEIISKYHKRYNEYSYLSHVKIEGILMLYPKIDKKDNTETYGDDHNDSYIVVKKVLFTESLSKKKYKKLLDKVKKEYSVE